MSQADRDKWNARYAVAAETPSEPSRVLVSLERFLPATGRALDIAGGAGRNAIWLAQRGLDVTIWDISSAGLELARQRAAAAGVTLKTVEVDLESPSTLSGRFDLILSVAYLHRPLFAQYPQLLAPAGTLVVIHPTRRNLQRNEKPPAAYLLDEGELPRLVPELDIVHYEEGWLADERHDAVLVARKPAAGDV
jgi:SAM-dependent methyltransferase